MSKAVKFYTEKDDKKVLQVMIQKQIAKQVEALNSLEVDNRDTFEETLENFKKDKKRVVQEEKEALEILQQPRDDILEDDVVQAVPDDDFDMTDDRKTVTHVEESDDEMENLAPQSKRGRGRGSRGSRGQSKIFLKLHFESFQVSPTFHIVMDPKSKCNWFF